MAEKKVVRVVGECWFALFVLAFLALLSCPRAVLAGGGPRNVLVVANVRSDVSRQIAHYYQNARGIPQCNMLYISCPTDEIVSQSVCESQIRSPIAGRLQAPDMVDIDYIVLTKGIPLAANYGHYSGVYSVTSILSCVAHPEIMTYMINPYGPQAALGGWPPAPERYWSSKLTFNGYKFYNVTRLDAFTFDDVKNMIDGAVASSVGGFFLLDKRTGLSGSYYTANERLGVAVNSAYEKLVEKDEDVLMDNTSSFITNQQNVIGYFSWGKNDPGYTYQSFTNNSFTNGSIGDMYYSFSARTFNFVDPSTPNRDALIADLFPKGLCGAGGYVSEPYISTATFPNVLFDRYTKGYNLAESFFASCTELFWKTTVVGDPLMAPFATPPIVDFTGLGIPLTGSSASLKVDASDTSGIAKVEFYIDDTLVGTAVNAPFEINFDSTDFIVGVHNVEAIAYESSPVFTQGFAQGQIEIVNDVSTLARISQSAQYPDGQIVTLTNKVVMAGTGSVRPGFYIEESDRSSGIYVTSGVSVSEGNIVDILGAVGTVDGERVIVSLTAPTIKGAGAAIPKPLGMPNWAVGGSPSGSFTSGIGKGIGVRNVGLLVRIWGTVSASGSGWFYVDDGSCVSDGSGKIGIKIISSTIPAIGEKVAVTGVSSAESSDSGVIPVVRARASSDIQVYD